MSGVEIVGLVLGAWPIVVELAKAGKGFKDSSLISELELAFDTDLHVLRNFVLHMLEGLEGLSEQERTQLSSANEASVQCWQDEDLADKLRESLGIGTFNLIIRHMREVDRVLKRLKSKLAYDDLGLARQNTARNSFKRFIDILPGSGLRLDLNELRNHVRTLGRVLKATGKFATYESPKTVPARHRKLSTVMKMLARNPHFFNNFYNALDASFHCDCTEAHDINVRLRPDQFETLIAIQEELNRTSSEPNLGFATSPISEPTFGLGEDGRDPSESMKTKPNLTSSPSTKAEHRAMPILFNFNVLETEDDKDNIPDLCHLIKTLDHPGPHQNRYLGYLGQESKYLVKLPTRNLETKNSQCIACLDDCLLHSEPWGLSWRKRVDLAHSLTLAVFQFYPSQWIDTDWSWKDFSMAKTPKQLQLFITRKFYSSEVGTPVSNENKARRAASAKFWKGMSIFGIDPALGRLGCALVELALGMRLSELHEVSKNKLVELQGRQDDEDEDDENDEEEAPDAAEYLTARRLLEAEVIRDEVGIGYHNAVEACLLCEVVTGANNPTRRRLSSKNEDFQDDFEKYVVDPLREYHYQQWGETFDDGFPTL